jgi:hypothetical protein
MPLSVEDFATFGVLKLERSRKPERRSRKPFLQLYINIYIDIYILINYINPRETIQNLHSLAQTCFLRIVYKGCYSSGGPFVAI